MSFPTTAYCYASGAVSKAMHSIRRKQFCKHTQHAAMPKIIQEANPLHRCIEATTRKKSTFLRRNVDFFFDLYLVNSFNLVRAYLLRHCLQLTLRRVLASYFTEEKPIENSSCMSSPTTPFCYASDAVSKASHYIISKYFSSTILD